MSDASRPQLGDITRAFAQLADRALTMKSAGLDPFVAGTLRLALRELELYIPGLEPPQNAEAARAFGDAAEIAIRNGDEREALSYALRGLSCSPHDPTLWYLAGSACIELGGIETAIRMLHHALWIHPGHREARRDLESLTSFFDGAEGDRAA